MFIWLDPFRYFFSPAAVVLWRSWAFLLFLARQGFLLLMLLDWSVLGISVLTYFPACQKGQVPLHTCPQLPALKAGVPQGFAGRGHGCCLTVQGRMQPVLSSPTQHLCLAAKYLGKNRQRGLLKQTCRISGLDPDAQDSVGNSRSHSHSV